MAAIIIGSVSGSAAERIWLAREAAAANMNVSNYIRSKLGLAPLSNQKRFNGGKLQLGTIAVSSAWHPAEPIK